MKATTQSQPRRRLRSGLLGPAVAMLLVAGGGTGCFAPEGGAPKSSASTPVANTAETALAKAAQSLPQVISSTGPVICSTSEGGWEATAFDDTFRTKVATFAVKALETRLAGIAQEAGGERAFVRSLCGAEGEAGVSPVSPDGKRVAVQVDGGTTGKHVGWLDLGTGKFTDITKNSAKSGYSTETFSDETPGFAPDGSFWFLRDSQEYVSADASGRLTRHQLSVACSYQGDEDIFYRPVKSVAVTCPRTIHPSGKFAADPTKVAVGIYTADGFRLDLLARKVDRFSDAPIHRPLSMRVVVRDRGELRGCTPMAWVDTDDLLCMSPGNDFYTVRVNPAAARDDYDYVRTIEVKVKAEIAPATESRIVSVAVSHDRRSLLIASSPDGEASTTKLYRASLTAPSEPVELGPLPAGVPGDFTFLGNFQKSDW